MMRARVVLFFVLAFTFASCGPAASSIATSTGAAPTPVVETQAVTQPAAEPSPAATQPGYQPVSVDQVEVEVGVGSPIPVFVHVSGNLPDTCAQLELVQLQQEGSTFDFTVSAIPSDAEGCVQDTLPFRASLPLNVVGLPGGSYSVVVNETNANFTLDTGGTGTVPDAGADVTKDDIPVSNVNIEVGVGSPIPVHAIVSGELPNSCAQLGEIRLHREETTFWVRLIAYTPAGADCTADSLPFRLEVPLNVVNLPEGTYTVNVNGTEASFDPRTEPAEPGGLADFESSLQSALLERDEEAIRALMGDEFIMAFWQSEGVTLPADEAAAQLLSNYIAEGSALTFQEFQPVPGFDPQAMVGPDVELAKAIHVTGWGLEGQDEALVIVAHRPDGSLFWHSVLHIPEGFAPTAEANCTPPEEVPVVDGKVSYRGISFALDPALQYTVAARSCPAVALQENQASGEAHPPYIAFTFPTFNRQNVDFQPELRVYEVGDDMSSYTFPLNVLPDLKAAIDQRPEPVEWLNAAPLHARQRYLDFANGAGVRGLVQHMQDFFFYTNNGLTYEFHGLTEDGRYAVVFRHPLSVPFLMELSDETVLPPENQNPQAIAIPEWPADFEQQKKVIEDYNTEALARLEAMADSEAAPDIALLDELVQSLQVSQTGQ